MQSLENIYPSPKFEHYEQLNLSPRTIESRTHIQSNRQK